MRSSASINPEIPTASMADVAFLLIIFFMLTAALAAKKGLDYALPKDDRSIDVELVESIYLEVQAPGVLVVDGEPMALAVLDAYLLPRLEANPEKPVILRTAPNAPYRAMVQVYDVLRQMRDRLHLAEDLVIAIPTEREIEQLW